MTTRLQRAAAKVKRTLNISPMVGRLGTGTDGTVRDSDNPGNYWVRFANSDGEYSAPISIPLAVNANLPDTDNLPVEVGWRKERMIILGAQIEGLDAAGVNREQFNPLNDPNDFVNQERLTPLRAFPHPDTANYPFTIVVYPGWVNVAGVPTFFPGGSVDVTSLQPAAGDHAFVAAFIKTDMTLEALAGTSVDNADPLPPTDIQTIAASATIDSLPIKAWNLSGDDTSLSADPALQVDLRSAFNSKDDSQTLLHSSGVVDGSLTYITPVDATHIDVAAGRGMIRVANSAGAQLIPFTWPASANIAIPAGAGGVDAVRYVGVEYNSGTPQVTVRTTFNWNWYSDFPLGRVSQDGTSLRIINVYAHAEDTANLARRFLRLVLPFQREEPPEGSGGLVISDISGQHLGMSAGNVWHGFNRYVLAAVDTSGADRFDLHYRTSGAGFNHVASQATWPNDKYDDGSGTLVTMTNNRYACLWIYVDVSDGSMDMLYGRNQYTSIALAQAETAPATTPGHLAAHGKLLGRFIFQKSAVSASLVESVWTVNFTAGTVLSLDDLTDVTIASAAKGDILARSSTAWDNVAVGADGDSLIASSAATNGVSYLNTGKLRVTNSSGATANAGDVGYIDNTGVYKTTTTAALVASWCAVVAGGTNTSTITVIKSGRITLNYTGSAPVAGNYLTTSTSAGLVQAYTLAHRGIMAVALANGSGGTVDALLLCNSEDVDASDANDIFSINLVSTIAFTSTVSGTPNATSFVYGAVVTGAENVLVPTSATLLGKALMWNTTRTQARMMTAVNTGTNAVTNVSVTDAWANTDALTIESQTCVTGQTWKAMDIDISQSTSVLPANIRTIYADLIVRDTTAGATSFASIHPYETFAVSKLQTQYMGVNSVFNAKFVRIPIIDNRFCVTGAFGGAGTGSIFIRLNGYKIAAP